MSISRRLAIPFLLLPQLLTTVAMYHRYVQNTIGGFAPLEAFYIDPRPRTAYKKWVCLHYHRKKHCTSLHFDITRALSSHVLCDRPQLIWQHDLQRNAADVFMCGFLVLQLMGITQRINTINGRKYSEDPTIFAWELCNECQ